MLMTMGQLVPCIGHRPQAGEHVVLYAGQRRLLAARASHELAADGLQPVRHLLVLLLDHQPSADEIRRIQAQENQREDLTLWPTSRPSSPTAGRPAPACASATACSPSAPTSGSARSRPTTCAASSPCPRRSAPASPSGPPSASSRSRSPTGSPTCTTSRPQLTEAVAARITTGELHDAALRDPGAFVHRTLVEDASVYAVRIDDGALLDAHAQLTQARAELTDATRAHAASALGCARRRARRRARQAASPRPRRRTRRCASTAPCATAPAPAATPTCTSAAPTSPPASGSSTPCSCSTPSPTRSPSTPTTTAPADPAYFAGAGLDAPDLREAAGRRARAPPRAAPAPGRGRALEPRARPRPARRAARPLPRPTRRAARDRLPAARPRLPRPARLRRRLDGPRTPTPGRRERTPRTEAIDAIVEAELERALAEPDPLRGIAALVARCAAAFVLDPDGVTRTKVLGSERMSRKLHEALPGGEEPLRAAVWAFLRPMLSPRLVDLHRDAFIARRRGAQHRRPRGAPWRLHARRPRSRPRRGGGG